MSFCQKNKVSHVLAASTPALPTSCMQTQTLRGKRFGVRKTKITHTGTKPCGGLSQLTGAKHKQTPLLSTLTPSCLPPLNISERHSCGAKSPQRHYHSVPVKKNKSTNIFSDSTPVFLSADWVISEKHARLDWVVTHSNVKAPDDALSSSPSSRPF